MWTSELNADSNKVIFGTKILTATLRISLVHNITAKYLKFKVRNITFQMLTTLIRKIRICLVIKSKQKTKFIIAFSSSSDMNLCISFPIYMERKSSVHSSPCGAFCVTGSSSAPTCELSASAPNIKFHSPAPGSVLPPLPSTLPAPPVALPLPAPLPPPIALALPFPLQPLPVSCLFLPLAFWFTWWLDWGTSSGISSVTPLLLTLPLDIAVVTLGGGMVSLAYATNADSGRGPWSMTGWYDILS